MKRVIFSVLATIFSLVALLSFKSHSHTALGAKLPSASLATSSVDANPTPAPTTSAAPPNPSSPGATVPSTSPRATTPAATTPRATAPRATAPAATAPAATAKNYDGTAVQTRYGTVQVEVTVAGGKITNVSFLQLSSYDGRSADINSQAGPLLLQETLAAQSGNIDTISGATYTSDGYVQSLQSALDQAGLK